MEDTEEHVAAIRALHASTFPSLFVVQVVLSDNDPTSEQFVTTPYLGPWGCVASSPVRCPVALILARRFEPLAAFLQPFVPALPPTPARAIVKPTAKRWVRGAPSVASWLLALSGSTSRVHRRQHG